MRKVLLVQPSLQPPGGGNSVAAWMLEALTREHHVTVLSWRPVDVDDMNRFYGTSIQRGSFDTVKLPRHWMALPDALPVPAALLRTAVMTRYTRRYISDDFDVVIGANNEADYGRRGIQYVHYPTYVRPRPKVDFRWYHQSDRLLNAYYWLSDRVADVSLDRIRANLTLVNSDWTGRVCHARMGVQSQTLYPPVVGSPSGIEWHQRRTAFLAIGRLAPEKKLERVMRILSRVRQSLPDITLTIVGSIETSHRYHRSLLALQRSLGSWISLRYDISRTELMQLMATHRYGLHGMDDEHFGMAPAEMVTAGMIVWVPNSGGQVEIVGHGSPLAYDSDEQAAEHIVQVAQNEHEQRRLREHLAARASLFGVDRFVEQTLSIVRSFRS